MPYARSDRTVTSSVGRAIVFGRCGGVASRHGRADALLDVAAQLRLRPQEKEDFRADEERPDDELHHVVEEGRLHALELVAEELQRPAGREDSGGPRERGAGGGSRGDLARRGAHREQHHRHGEAEDPVETKVVGAHGDRRDRGHRDRHVRHVDDRGGEREDDREDDHRNAGEVRCDIAAVAMVCRVLGEVFLDASHYYRRSSDSSEISIPPKGEGSLRVAPGIFAFSAIAGMIPELPSSRPRLVAESALPSASSTEILPWRTRRKRSCSKVCDPGDMLFSIASLISLISPFSISSWMLRVLRSTSTAGVRLPSMVLMRRCEMTAFSDTERSCSSIGRTSSGKKLMTRFIAW